MKNQNKGEVAFVCAAGKILQRDLRYTTDATFDIIEEITSIDWKPAYDPIPATAKVGQDSLTMSWNEKANIFLNPPFSKSRYFVWKLLGEMDKYETIKRALVVLPWYQVKGEHLGHPSLWFSKLAARLEKYNVEIEPIKNATFWDPFAEKETKPRVFAVILSR